jgi:hypothetical protein
MFDVDEAEALADKLLASELPLDVEDACRVATKYEFLALRALREYDRTDRWRAEGYLSAAAGVRAKTNMAHGTAAAWLTLAKKLEQLPETAAAFSQGKITRQHAEVIARACTPERLDAILEVEGQLVSIAKVVLPKDLGVVVKRITDAIDGDDGVSDDDAKYARRKLFLSKTLDRLYALDGLLDAEGGEIVETAIEAEKERLRVEDDPRTPAQLRADALVSICRRTLERGDVGTSRGVRPHINVVIDLQEFEGTAPDVVAQVRNETLYGNRLSLSTLRRLACDCAINRILTDGASAVLDVGLTKRTVPPAIWKALVARDGHCTWAECDQPAHRCEAHHIIHWEDGGATNLENLRLLCWYHHRLQHRLDDEAKARSRTRGDGSSRRAPRAQLRPLLVADAQSPIPTPSARTAEPRTPP